MFSSFQALQQKACPPQPSDKQSSNNFSELSVEGAEMEQPIPVVNGRSSLKLNGGVVVVSSDQVTSASDGIASTPNTTKTNGTGGEQSISVCPNNFLPVSTLNCLRWGSRTTFQEVRQILQTCSPDPELTEPRPHPSFRRLWSLRLEK